jgi:asparagine synthetase B (glutamine-hydrolysing)
MAELRDWQGVRRLYVRQRDGAQAGTLQRLVETPFQFDRLGVEAAWGFEREPSLRTVIEGISQAASEALYEPRLPLREAFLEAVARLPSGAALALGGGLDGALVLAGLRELGMPMPALLTLETGLAGYVEVDRARAVAKTFAAPLQVVCLQPETLIELLPQAIAAIEAPLYNLHPLSRLALAIEARSRGFTHLITGDGADAACAGKADLDYVPLVAALTECAGLRLASPFFANDVIAGARGADKQKLRELGAQLGLEELITQAPKTPRLMPALDVSRYQALERLAPELARGDVRSTTLGLLARHLGRT